MMYAQHMQSAKKKVRVSKWMRQTNRWFSIVFLATIFANFCAMARGVPPAWIVYAPLPLLVLMLLTGLYMFVQPYLPMRR